MVWIEGIKVSNRENLWCGAKEHKGKNRSLQIGESYFTYTRKFKHLIRCTVLCKRCARHRKIKSQKPKKSNLYLFNLVSYNPTQLSRGSYAEQECYEAEKPYPNNNKYKLEDTQEETAYTEIDYINLNEILLDTIRI